MSTKRFRFFLFLSLGLSILGAAIDLWTGSKLPTELNQQLDKLYLDIAAWRLVVATIGFSIGLVLGLFSFVGLYFFKNWAPSLAINSTLLTGAILPLLPPFISSGSAEMMSFYSAMLWGMVLLYAKSEAYKSECQRRAAA